MLSICIPVYNYDVRELVHELHQQAVATQKPFEILLADDGSDPTFTEKNQELASLENVVWMPQNNNIGRSRIRNLLVQTARYPKLIFMDCDSLCPDIYYLRRYIDVSGLDGVVCGGRSYDNTPPKDKTYLHWLFGTRREVKSAQIRSKRPNHSFMANNFMISRSILQEIPFNESLMGYGHEDTLLGIELLKKKITIKHIENPLIHAGLDPAVDFLSKTKEGTRNLLKVYSIVKRDKALPEMVKLLRMWSILRSVGLCRITGIFIRVFEPLIVSNLKSKRPKLYLLDLFKLGSICRQTIKFKKDQLPSKSSR